MNFSQALDLIKQGRKAWRTGWNGRDMYIRLVNADLSMSIRLVEEIDMECLPFIVMRTADKKIVPWLASQTDILGEDWEIL